MQKTLMAVTKSPATRKQKGEAMKLTDQEAIQAITDALGGLAIALGKQLDATKLANDLRNMAQEAQMAGQSASAGLISEMARTVEVRLIK